MRAKDYSKINWESILIYDETSPSGLIWKIDLFQRNGSQIRKSGDIAGSLSLTNYWKLIHLGEGYACHRIIYLLVNGNISSGDKIDHIDGDGSNNRVSNLRLVSQKINTQNKKKRSDNISSITGVMLITRNKGTTDHWEAQWVDYITGKLKSKSFAVNKYGYDGAFKLACEYRSRMIQEQNNLGACYTDRHGQ